MYDFTNKNICLVLTCNKVTYKERRNKNMHIYSKLQNAGFEIVYLFADEDRTDYHIIKGDLGHYSLTVPTEEAYLNLSVKMWMAYSFFNTQSVKGILKIDDDVYYLDDEILDLDYYTADYLGMPCGDEFFYGPFYWVSNKAIQYIANSDIHPRSFKQAEDLFVGKCLKDKINLKWYKTKWKENGYIKYSNTCQRFNQYMSTPEYCNECILCLKSDLK